MKRRRPIAALIAVSLLVGAALQWPIQWLLASHHSYHISKARASGFPAGPPVWPIDPLPAELRNAGWPPTPEVAYYGDDIGYQHTYAHLFPRQSRPDLVTSLTTIRVGLPWRGLGMWRATFGRTGPTGTGPVTSQTIVHGGFNAQRPKILWPQGADLPYLPIWPGFALNTVVFATALAGAWHGVRLLRRRLRQKLGTCRRCGYSRESLAEGAVCPECGEAAHPRTLGKAASF